MMLGLLEQHNDRKVTGGTLDGLTFGELNEAQLKKAIRKYPTDPTLRKFARAKVALYEIGNSEEPVPCAPLRIVPVVQAQNESNWKSDIWSSGKIFLRSWLSNKYVCYGILALFFVLLFKPPVSTSMTKFIVRVFRLVVRKAIHFVVMLLEGLIDEVIYQLDKLMKGALPNDLTVEDIPSASLHLVSHVFSALMGAGFSLLTSYIQARRAQVG